MGEAARRRRQGFDGRKLGDDVVAALNANAGGEAWAVVREGAQPEQYLVLGADEPGARAAFVTNRQAEETPHRVVMQTLYRRGEPWLMSLVFDPSEQFRADLYTQLARDAVRVVHAAGDERIDTVHHQIIHSSWLEHRDNVNRVSVQPGA
jgi:hypothetical protein